MHSDQIRGNGKNKEGEALYVELWSFGFLILCVREGVCVRMIKNKS